MSLVKVEYPLIQPLERKGPGGAGAVGRSVVPGSVQFYATAFHLQFLEPGDHLVITAGQVQVLQWIEGQILLSRIFGEGPGRHLHRFGNRTIGLMVGPWVVAHQWNGRKNNTLDTWPGDRAKYRPAMDPWSNDVPVQPVGFLGFLFDQRRGLRNFGAVVGQMHSAPVELSAMTVVAPLALLVCLTVVSDLSAQMNDKGTFHAALGISLGGHATRYEQTINVLGVPVRSEEEDGAVTVTYPIQLGYGFARWFSLGVSIEPGSYLDSNATRANALMLICLEPRFYLVNKERFAWMASMQFGASNLRIDDQGANEQARYSGAQLSLTSGVGFLFSEHVGLHLHLRYLTTRMPLVEFSANGTSLSLEDFDAELKTQGIGLQASLAFNF